MIARDNNKRAKILKELDVIKDKDISFSSGHILGSMCTQPHPIAKEAYFKFLETNLGDPELFPGTKEIETKLIAFISDLLHAPTTSGGQIVNGGTEGNLTAIWIAKQLHKKKEIIIPESAHFSFKKISSIMDLKLIKVPLTKEYHVDVRSIKRKINTHTCAVVGVAGSTELGTIDPIPQISDICYDEHLFLHIDAAFGGYVIPFLKELQYPIPDFDFLLKGVSTVSVDAHKMGYSAIPLGILIARKNNWFDEISVDSPYISVKRHAGVVGTRSGGPVAAAYAIAKYLGFIGYQNLVKTCMNTTQYTAEKITEIGLQLVTKPTLNVLGVKLNKLYKVVNKLSLYGWKVNKIDHLSCIRIVIMPQITKQIIDEFIPILQKSCEEVGEL
jgi:tyrosine decarboxylase/aspartate 1-decarboxylase